MLNVAVMQNNGLLTVEILAKLVIRSLCFTRHEVYKRSYSKINRKLYLSLHFNTNEGINCSCGHGMYFILFITFTRT